MSILSMIAVRARGARRIAAGAVLGLMGLALTAQPAAALGPKSGVPPQPGEERAEGPKQGPDALLDRVGIAQRLGATLPLETRFTTSEGERVALGDLLGERPAILALVYYECPMLCTMVLNGMLRMLNVLKFDVGKELDVVTVSIDPRETPALAADKKRMYLERYRREGAEQGWHFLVGDQASVSTLAEAVGFEYAYDEETDQFAHGSAIMVVTPDGRLSKYFYGIDYSPVDVRLALIEAASERIGSLADAIILACFQYDPMEGRYSLAIMRVVRLAGVATVLALLGFVLFHVLRDRRRKGRPCPADPGRGWDGPRGSSSSAHESSAGI